ncbi:mitochondrial genome maintenance exonuclease 1-like [Anopheles nili]|uniref:mitochondrial genome maintenance exonuclease 1-like n=1 Tax=Anopheles nili TaxID=185578 RepID=UPI00237B7E86|nr:mitochondrial genome maintenance exonuclease 1-like [Anopheles nili]
MFKYSAIRVYSTAAKSASKKLSKAATIKKLNFENKALFGAVKKSTKKKLLPVETPTTQLPNESEFASEIYWQGRSASWATTMNPLSEKQIDKEVDSPPGLLIPFSTKELKTITQFPLVPTKNGILEQSWMLHKQHENAQCKSPSVSRVLSATMSESSREALLRWKSAKIAELGEEGFQQLQRDIFVRGSTLHTTLETWLTGSEPSQEMIQKSGALWESVLGALDQVERPAKMIEQKLYHPFLHYNGVVDCVINIKGQYHVTEWKTSDNPKKTIAATYDAPIQLCAYLGALQANEELRDGTLQNGAIFVAYTNGKPANVHILNSNEIRKYWQIWLNRLQEYWTRYRDGTLPDPI